MDSAVILGALLVTYVVVPYFWIHSRQEDVWAREKNYLHKGTESKAQSRIDGVLYTWLVGFVGAVIAYYFDLMLLASAVLVVAGIAMAVRVRARPK